MSLDAIKASCQALSAEDRLALLFYLRHLLRAGQPSNRRELDQLHHDIDAGEKTTLAQLRAVHEVMNREGL
jgi:hypothetical protein